MEARAAAKGQFTTLLLGLVPSYVLIAAPAAGFAIGALAGLYPARRARLSPTEALRA